MSDKDEARAVMHGLAGVEYNQRSKYPTMRITTLEAFALQAVPRDFYVQRSPAKVYWSSSAPAIARVSKSFTTDDEKIMVSGERPGKAFISAWVDDEPTPRLKIRVLVEQDTKIRSFGLVAGTPHD